MCVGSNREDHPRGGSKEGEMMIDFIFDFPGKKALILIMSILIAGCLLWTPFGICFGSDLILSLKDNHGDPVRNEQVILNPIGGRMIVGRTWNEGIAKFNDLKNGIYEFSGTSPSYKFNREKISISDGINEITIAGWKTIRDLGLSIKYEDGSFVKESCTVGISHRYTDYSNFGIVDEGFVEYHFVPEEENDLKITLLYQNREYQYDIEIYVVESEDLNILDIVIKRPTSKSPTSLIPSFPDLSIIIGLLIFVVFLVVRRQSR